MHRFLYSLRPLFLCGTFLVAALLLSGCDSNGFDEDENDTLAGTWTAVAAVDWSRTFALPAGASIDSVRYLHAGTHRVIFNLTETDGTVTGTIDWDVEGLFASNEYNDGNATTEVDDVDLDRDPEAVSGTYDAPTFTVERSGTTNAWLSPLDAVAFTLDADELSGQLTFRYSVTDWTVAGSPNPFTTRFEFPVSLRLMRAATAPAT